MATIINDIAKRAKSNAVKSIGNAVFGKGLIGRALNRSFTKKFGEGGGDGDSRVTEALETQTKIQDDNSAILTRIESIVMNIADNVYNLAGVMNAQVVSMQEAQRLQQEKAYKDAAAQEEANAEAKKINAPTVAATQPVKEKGGGIMDAIKGIMGSIGSIKFMFKGFLKKFGVLALGLTSALGIAATFTGDEGEDVEGLQSFRTLGAVHDGQGGYNYPSSSPQTTQVTSSSSSSGMSSGFVGIQSQSAGGGRGFINPSNDVSAESTTPSSPPTPVTPPPPIAATAMTKDEEAAKAKDYFTQPENVAEATEMADLFEKRRSIDTSLDMTKKALQAAKTPSEKRTYRDLIDKLVSARNNIDVRREAIMDNVRKKGFQTVPSVSTSPTSGALSGAASGSGSSNVGGLSGGSSGGGGGSSASLATTPPSTGASIGEASTAVAAASEPQPAKNNFSEINSSNDVGTPPPTAIPSPIANRGSLDIGTVFGSES